MTEYILAGIGLCAVSWFLIFIIEQIVRGQELKNDKPNNNETSKTDNNSRSKVLNEILKHKYNPKDDEFMKRFEKKMDEIIRK